MKMQRLVDSSGITFGRTKSNELSLHPDVALQSQAGALLNVENPHLVTPSQYAIKLHQSYLFKPFYTDKY